jgi:hypothetical protein
MTKFRYIGEYPEGKSELVVFGCVFSPGAEIELTGRFVGKARGNRFFEEVAEVVEVSPVDPEPEVDDERATLIAEAGARGIKIDKRWSTQKLAQKLKDA